MNDQADLDYFQSQSANDNAWKEVSIAEVVKINDYPSLEKEQKHRYVAMDDLDECERKVKNISEKEYKYSAPRFRNEDTLFPKMSRCLENGKTGFVDILDDGEVAFGSTEFVVLTPTDDILPKYVYYTMRRPRVVQKALKWRNGTTARRQRISTDVFDEIQIKLPPIKDQKRIIEVLDPLDSKIENNQRESTHLEEICRTIFLSEFVDFEPYAEFKETSLGEIPVEFTVSTLTDICNLVLGGTPERGDPDYWNGDVEWVKAGDVSNAEDAFVEEPEEYITGKGFEQSSTEKVPANATVIVARGATTGEIAMVPYEMAINQTCYGLVANREFDQYFLFFLLDSLIHELKSRTHGTVFDTVTKRTLEEQQIMLPPERDRRRFDDIVSPLLEKMKINHRENVKLREIRNLLLPKLMSGEIGATDMSVGDELVSSGG